MRTLFDLIWSICSVAALVMLRLALRVAVRTAYVSDVQAQRQASSQFLTGRDVSPDCKRASFLSRAQDY
jgi:hypothetical protein